jgi:hypothetical protein
MRRFWGFLLLTYVEALLLELLGNYAEAGKIERYN